MLKEFRNFALRGNVVDLAVGFIVGGAFATIVSSLVNDLLMPPVGLLVGSADFSELYLLLRAGEDTGPYATLADAQAAGAVTMNYGRFANSVVGFVIVALCMFFVVRAIGRLQSREADPPAPATKPCPFCLTSVPVQASRCPACTSQLEDVPTVAPSARN